MFAWKAGGLFGVSASSIESIRICNSLIHNQKSGLKMAIEDVLQKVRDSTQDPTKKYHMFIANKPVLGNRKYLDVTNKYTGEVGMILCFFFIVKPRRIDPLVSPLLSICYRAVYKQQYVGMCSCSQCFVNLGFEIHWCIVNPQLFEGDEGN